MKFEKKDELMSPKANQFDVTSFCSNLIVIFTSKR